MTAGGLHIRVSDAMGSEYLFEPFFRGSSWNAWSAVIKAAHAEPMTDDEFATFRAVAERDPPTKRVREFIAAAGRGAGKDSIASLLATVAAINFDPRGKLRPGERAICMCLAVDRSQASIVFNYIASYFDTIPALRKLVTERRATSISLSNGVDIEVHTSSFRSVRGRTLLCAIFDECAFWADENSASPDTEIYNAVTPGLARMPGSQLIMISSVHKRSGLLYQRWKKYYGRDDDDVLVVKGTTLQFNPLFDADTIARSLEEDPERYGAEYNSIWRDDLTSFISRELLDSVTDRGVMVRPPAPHTVYYAGCDPSGGRNDSFTFSLAHRERDGTVVLDHLYEKKAPLNPTQVVSEISNIMAEYKAKHLTGDGYAAEWVVDAFAKAGLRYEKSERDRSKVYMDTLPLFTSGRVKLLDNPKMVSQFAALE